LVQELNRMSFFAEPIGRPLVRRTARRDHPAVTAWLIKPIPKVSAARKKKVAAVTTAISMLGEIARRSIRLLHRPALYLFMPIGAFSFLVFVKAWTAVAMRPYPIRHKVPEAGA
jgi:hypothetical protein